MSFVLQRYSAKLDRPIAKYVAPAGTTATYTGDIYKARRFVHASDAAKARYANEVITELPE